ncbi:MAG: hypothetical protein CMM18_00790 [Rhodospirillaceae bacterium]|nr:hypothetical protein [Rhodospirillaceae bacterium]
MIEDQEKGLGYSEAYDLLSKFKIKPTKQRMLITKEVFSKTPKHFTVQDIFVSLIRRNKKISLASVYNTLRKFVELGVLQEIYIEPNKSFFDTIVTPHYHIYDKSLGQLIDVPEGSVKISNLPDVPNGKKINGINLVINIENHSK